MHAGIHHPPPPGADPLPEQTPPLPDQTHPPGTDTPPGSRLQHTVNKRPVRILLECILALFLFTTNIVSINLAVALCIHERFHLYQTPQTMRQHPSPRPVCVTSANGPTIVSKIFTPLFTGK